jgi:hypothetical protein
MPCAMHNIHMEETRSAVSRFSLKTTGDGLSVVLPQNQCYGFLVWGSNQGRRCGDLDLKITAMVSWFGPQNQVGGGLKDRRMRPEGVNGSQSKFLTGT